MCTAELEVGQFSDQMAKQVVIASSVTPGELNDSSQSPETTYDIPDIVQPTKRKGGDTDKVIIISVETCNFIMAMHIVHLSAQDQLTIWRTH